MKLKIRKINNWIVHALEFENDDSVVMALIKGKPANVQTKSSKKKRLPWQQQIAQEIQKQRHFQRDSSKHYVISIGIRFSAPPTQKQPVDIDNFIKPIFAGVACGLFIQNEKIPNTLEQFRHYDDSHFDYLFVERLDPKQGEEGIVVVVSEKPTSATQR
jgi:hypothetical protein